MDQLIFLSLVAIIFNTNSTKLRKVLFSLVSVCPWGVYALSQFPFGRWVGIAGTHPWGTPPGRLWPLEVAMRILEFFTNYTKMPIVAFSSLLCENKKESSDKMLDLKS